MQAGKKRKQQEENKFQQEKKKQQGGKKRKRERKQASMSSSDDLRFSFSPCKRWKSCSKKAKFGKGKEERASYLVREKVWVEEEEKKQLSDKKY